MLTNDYVKSVQLSTFQIAFHAILSTMGKSKNAKRKPKAPDTTIVVNKKARYDYFIEDTFESGVALQGWEVKSLRLKKVQLVDSYVTLKDGEAFLLGCTISPLDTTNTHTIADPSRTKKLLLHKRELAKLFSITWDWEDYDPHPAGLYENLNNQYTSHHEPGTMLLTTSHLL